MQLGWLVRLAILVALILPIAFGQYCGFAESSFAAHCPVCAAIFGVPTIPDSPLEMQIIPDWYLLPAFGVLRSVSWDSGILTPKVLGLVVLLSAFLAPLCLVFYKWSSVRGRAWVGLIGIPVIVAGLGWVGAQSPTGPAVQIVGPLLTVLYFAWFIIVFPSLAGNRKAA